MALLNRRDPLIEVESSFFAAKQQKKKDKGKIYEVGASQKRYRRTGKSWADGSPSTSIFALDLWNPELSVRELGRQLTYNNTSWNFEIYLAIVQAIILSRDIIELQKEDEVMTCILLIMQNFQVSSLP